MNKEHKLKAASVEFGSEFGDFNAAKHYETAFNRKEHQHPKKHNPKGKKA